LFAKEYHRHERKDGMNQPSTTIFVHPARGVDSNSGAESNPLRTLAEAARRVNHLRGAGAVTIILAEGIYAIGETISFKPESWTFSRDARLNIRAEVLPDDPAWHIGRMPTLIHTMPLPVPPTWNGNPDPLGGAANGMVIESSHVTIQGLKFLGLPVVETPQPGLKRRVYAIGRFNPELEDLEIAQCLFAGGEIIAPLHVGVIARGNGLVVHHCIFHGFMKDAVVFWSGGSTGHAMRNCLVHGAYGSAIYTAGVANDLDYRNNVVDSCEQVWVYQDAKSAQQDARGQAVARSEASQAAQASTHYQAIDSVFANNGRMVARGVGAKLEFSAIDDSFIEQIGVQQLSQPIALEHDQTQRRYLHPVAGSEAAKVGAGLFMLPGVE
jgi:hypothetical protein